MSEPTSNRASSSFVLAILVSLAALAVSVVALVLIFLLNRESEADILLSEASAAKPLTSKPNELVVGIDKEGRYAIDAKEFSEAELNREFRKLKEIGPTPDTVLIRADKDVALKHVVIVLDLCNRYGFRDYQLVTAGESQ